MRYADRTRDSGPPGAPTSEGMRDRPWLSLYPPEMRNGLHYPSHPLHAYLESAASRYPDRDAIVYYDGESRRELYRVQYQALADMSRRFACSLVGMGVVRGDRVAHFLQNSPQLVASFYGILGAGAVVVPCNPMYRGQELAGQLEDSRARFIVCDAELLPIVEEVRHRTSVERVIVVGGEGPDGFDHLVEAGQEAVSLPEVDLENDLAMLCYTGGTTGIPKGAMLSHRNLVVNAAQFARWYRYREGAEVFISCLPLFHIGGISGAMSVPISVAGTMVLFRRFHARGVLQAIQDYGATRFLGVPTMYIATLEVEDASSYDLSSLTHSRTSAAPLPAAVKRSFDELVGRNVLVEGYGLTETAPLTHANPPDAAREGSIGVPLPDTDAMIVDADTGVGPPDPGDVGELVIRGPQVMQGYWGRQEETAEAMRGGWFHTGDLARLDGDGYFYIVDRKKDVINAAGFKVWPREIEEVLYRHPSVRLAAVVGEPDAYRGETVKAVVVLRDEYRAAGDRVRVELMEWCRAELAAYKRPRVLEFRDSLPLSAAGKLLKRELR